MMTYNLEEFKAWLEEKEERKNHPGAKLYKTALPGIFQKIAELGIEPFLNSIYYIGIHPVIKQWKAQVDH